MFLLTSFVASLSLLVACEGLPGQDVSILLATQEVPIPSGPDAADVKVCIIDTGIAANPNIPSLTDGTITGESMIPQSWKQDTNGMGTAIAGVIAANGKGDTPTMGIIHDASADGITLHIVPVLNKDHSPAGRLPELVSALEECKNANAKVITMAFHIADINGQLAYLLNKYYNENNMLFVSAVGNGASEDSWFPASHPAVIGVSAVMQESTTITTDGVTSTGNIMTRLPMSNWHPEVEIAACADRLRTTWKNGGSVALTGTEMAAAIISGAAALLWSYDSSCTHAQIRTILLMTAQPVGTTECDHYHGYGHVQLHDAVQLLQSMPCDGGNTDYDPENAFLDDTGRWAWCPATDAPSYVPSSSNAPSSAPTIQIQPLKASKSKSGRIAGMFSCAEALTQPKCKSQTEPPCYWDSVNLFCTRNMPEGYVPPTPSPIAPKRPKDLRRYL